MHQHTDFLGALIEIEKEKNIDKEVIFEALEASLETACRKNFSPDQQVKVKIDRNTGEVEVFLQLEVVEEVLDPEIEISVEDAREKSIHYEVGDFIDVQVTPRDFDRIAAQTAKQVVVQKLREAERDQLFDEYATKEREIVTGIISRADRNNIVVSLGKVDGYLSANERIPGELYHQGERIKVFVLEVRPTTKGPHILVSRTHPDLVKRLFEQMVPEVYDGTVEIKSIAREAGSRTKMAVYSRHEDVDPVGACVGQNGVRVGRVVEELNGEKIDIVHWSINAKEFISAALKPSEVLYVELYEDSKSALIVVPDNQLSLSIGKSGQNARLAAKLTGWRIDIKSETQAREEGVLSLPEPFSLSAEPYEARGLFDLEDEYLHGFEDEDLYEDIEYEEEEEEKEV